MDKPARRIFKALLLISVISGLNSERIVLKTRPGQKVYNFFPLFTDYIEFDVRATNDIHILLSETYDYFGKWYEMVLGGWSNSRSVLRRDHDDNIVVDVQSEVVNEKIFDKYWVLIDRTQGTVSLGKKPSKKPILHYRDRDFVNVSYIGFSTGFGSTGEWFIDSDYFRPPCQECVCKSINMY